MTNPPCERGITQGAGSKHLDGVVVTGDPSARAIAGFAVSTAATGFGCARKRRHRRCQIRSCLRGPTPLPPDPLVSCLRALPSPPQNPVLEHAASIVCAASATSFAVLAHAASTIRKRRRRGSDEEEEKGGS